jgi:c-di-GMP phosphodiesterase
MAELFVARQPIFQRGLKVAGYELLFRGGPASAAVVTNAERATATVVINSFTEIGLDRLVGNHPAWINVTREFVIGDLARSLPPKLVLLELLEHQVVDDALIAALTDLKQRGYRLALDDFEYEPAVEPLLGLVNVVKLDLIGLGREGLAREVERLTPYGMTLLAEKLETHEDYHYCLDLGCDLFQGYFFCRPELIRDVGVDANKLSLLSLLAALEDPNVELSELERMIAHDLGLSYRLLRYINSAFFGLRQEVRSIGQALALLGTHTLKHWAALSIFASIEHKSPELTMTALIRARFCELAGQEHRGRGDAGELFTLGLFSVIDALMDAPIESIIERIPFPQDMRDALICHCGEKGRLLECLTALEAGAFEDAEAIVPNAGELHLASLMWATEAANPLYADARAAA